MPAAESGKHLLSGHPLFGRVLNCKACKFVGLLHSDLLTGCCPCSGVCHVRQRCPAISISRHHGGHPAGMQRPQARIDRGQRLLALGGHRGVLQFALGGVDVADGPASRASSISWTPERFAD